MTVRPVLAIIPARGGSKGLPGKNIRPLAGMPLIAHSIALAGLCPEIDRCIVSTDSPEIAAVAEQYGGSVPFLRPTDLAQDDTPMWPVLQHAFKEIERRENRAFGGLMLLDPTSPGRFPEDVAGAVAMLEQDKSAVGVIAVSEPHFNPRWVCVEERDGYLAQAFPDKRIYTRRQDVPKTYRINAVLYLWRRDYLLVQDAPKIYENPHRMLLVPEERAVHIDDMHDFQLAEVLLRESIIEFPWLKAAERHA